MTTIRRGSKEDIIQKFNKAISDLVYDKSSVKKAYNYYHGKMDMNQYKHFEENYGIGTPTQIKFIPLIKKHVDYLVGKFLDLPLNIQISCKDQKTLSNIFREKQLYILDKVKNLYMKDLYNQVLVRFGTPSNVIPKDPLTEEFINGFIDDLGRNFISEYEIAAQHLINYMSQSRNIDLRNKLRLLYTDLLISGTVYFKEEPSQDGTNVNLEQLNPINTFVEKNPNSYYLKDSPRSVCRYFMTADQILSKYSKELTSEDKKKLTDHLEKGSYVDGQTYIMRSTGPVNAVNTVDSEYATGILGGMEVTPVWDGQTGLYSYNSKLITVYEIEYIETDSDGTMHRYSGVKITNDIYIVRERDLNVIRSSDNEKYCSLSVNGIFMTTRQNYPFSLVLATADLQDMYNILFFLRDNAVAVSGTKGIVVDVSKIPTFLDEDDETTRMLKFVAYVKQGFAPLNTAQSESGESMPNAVFNNYDMSLSYNSIQALDLAIDRIEQVASNITGAFREAIGGIEQRDAVSNVKVGVDQSLIVTKSYFANMNLVIKEICLDFLNIAKIVYKKGLTGSIILGDKYKEIFTALPEHFTVSDYDVNISDGQEAVRDLDRMEALNLELIKAGQIDSEIVFETAGCKSITDYKQKSLEAISRRKSETNQLQDLQRAVQERDNQLQEFQNQIKELQSQLQKVANENQKLQQNADSTQVEWYKAKAKDENDKERNKIENKKADIEMTQLYDNNPRNNEVKF